MAYDEVLGYLVQKTEESSVGMDLTLSMDGLIIVGTLIRSKLYYDYMSTIFEPSTDKSVKTTITGYSSDKTETEMWSRYAKDHKEFMTQMRNKEDGIQKYIHLHNVEIYQSFPAEPLRTVYWRGKLASIDGFFVGGMGRDPQTLDNYEHSNETT
jgi:hypothetical protein